MPFYNTSLKQWKHFSLDPFLVGEKSCTWNSYTGFPPPAPLSRAENPSYTQGCSTAEHPKMGWGRICTVPQDKARCLDGYQICSLGALQTLPAYSNLSLGHQAVHQVRWLWAQRGPLSSSLNQEVDMPWGIVAAGLLLDQFPVVCF